MAPLEINPRLVTWASDLEPGTIQQAMKTSRLSIVDGHVALMPDAHVGIGATVGSVIPTNGAIVPSAVGTDIGCGMIAVETNITADGLPDTLDPLHDWIRKVVPAGLGKGNEEKWVRQWRARTLTFPASFSREWKNKAAEQLGTLGSGNHFVEICLDERDRVWVVLHSGSRKIGSDIARYHMKKARGVMKEAMIKLEDPDLAYLVQGTPEFEHYIADMLWAQDYAARNRNIMMDEVLKQLFGYVSSKSGDEHRDGEEVRRVNCHHNFAQFEQHNGRGLWITRKGAIKADRNDAGVIPGSMGTRSYIVRGLGNPRSFNSCSHGAGRRMSRTQAKKLLTVESLTDHMIGKAWNKDAAEALLDEHPDAYKDIDTVMDDQRDLVEVEHELHQVLNYKGAK